LLVGVFWPSIACPALGEAPAWPPPRPNRAVRMRRRPTTLTPSRISPPTSPERNRTASTSWPRNLTLTRRRRTSWPGCSHRSTSPTPTATGPRPPAPTSCGSLGGSFARRSHVRPLRAIRVRRGVGAGPGPPGVLEYLDPRWPVRLATVWRMKDRAGTVDPTASGRCCANCWPAPRPPAFT